tara:strand:- start:164 stop:472 length:309 start_codon:yes stop_codon:yes gene_type:complete
LSWIFHRFYQKSGQEGDVKTAFGLRRRERIAYYTNSVAYRFRMIFYIESGPQKPVNLDSARTGKYNLFLPRACKNKAKAKQEQATASSNKQAQARASKNKQE